jgi:hypothetical protein
MSNTPITFEHACEIVQGATACIFDFNELSYPCVNEDCDGFDCIEINYHTEDGLTENTFDSDDKYFLSDIGNLVIHQGKHAYTIQTLTITQNK